MLHRKKLAEKLIAAESETERKSLLVQKKKQADEQLALALKEICYAAWAIEPTKAQRAALALKTLLKINPAKEIEALLFWVSGIAELTRGKINPAVVNLDCSATIFFQLGKEQDAAQTQVAKLIAFGLLGRYDEAFETGERALKIFEKYGDELAAGKIEMNLSNIAARRALHREAVEYCLSARKRFSKLGETGWQIMAENDLAHSYSELNEFPKAEKFYAVALENARRAKMLVTEAEIEANYGNLELFRGRFDAALKFLEQSRQKYETLGMPHQAALSESEIADIYLELNLANEALAIYEKTAKTLQKLKIRGDEARTRANFGRAAIFLNKMKIAARQLRKSAKLFAAEKNRDGAAAVKITEASLELEQKNFKRARKIAFEAKTLLGESENLRQRLMIKWICAEASRNLKDFVEAEKLLTEILAKANKREQPQIVQLVFNSLGQLFWQKGDRRQAERFFCQAMKLIESLRAPLPAEEFRMTFLANKLAPFENLAKIYLADHKIKNAFLIIERSRGRSLAESLDGAALQINKSTPVALTKKLKNLREELNWFYSRISRAEASELAGLQAGAQKREKQIAEVLRQIESTAERKFRDGEVFELKKLQTQLGDEKALIEFVKFDGFFSAFIVTEKKIHYVENLAEESEIFALLEGLRFQFGALRYEARFLENFIGELKKRADFYLRELHEKLIKPLDNFLENRDLVIVPVGALHYIPFHALRDTNEKYLIEKQKTSYAPSATVWQFLAAKPVKTLKSALFVGFADEKIPLINREIETLKKIFPEAKSFTGEKATFAAYTKNAAAFDILHLACHGQFRADNPLFSSLHLADGWITVRDIYSQKLKAGLVTLSACETGLNKVFGGDEILGLTRGFLTAGANSLVLSLWAVSDEATTALMKDFYCEIKGKKTPAEALQKAQCNFIRRNAHPYFWSPFAVIGK